MRPELAGAAVAVAVLAGCSGSPAAKQSAPELLSQARGVLDATSTLHFVLSASGVPETGTALVGGEGDVARPDRLAGKLTVRLSGFSASVKVVSVGGTFWANLPLSSGFTKVDPASYGFGNPARLLAPGGGVDQLLGSAANAALHGTERVSGDVVDEVTATLPGTVVARALVSADPSQPVTAEFAVARGSHQIRRVVLTGPFYVKGTASTFSLVLTRYGAPVTISAP